MNDVNLKAVLFKKLRGLINSTARTPSSGRRNADERWGRQTEKKMDGHGQHCVYV